MSVGGANRDSLARDADFAFEPRGDFVNEVRANAAVVHGEQNRRSFRVTANGQRLGPKPLLDAFGLRFAHGITRQACGIIRRYVDARGANRNQRFIGRAGGNARSRHQRQSDAEAAGKQDGIVGKYSALSSTRVREAVSWAHPHTAPVAQVSKPADLSRPGDGERDCLSEAKARPAGPSERERVSQSPISKSATHQNSNAT